MQKLILRSNLCPGDILTMTAAVESLHLTHPDEYATDVRTPAREIDAIRQALRQCGGKVFGRFGIAPIRQDQHNRPSVHEPFGIGICEALQRGPDLGPAAKTVRHQ